PSYRSPSQTRCPDTGSLSDLSQHVLVRFPRALEDMEAVIGAFQPAHGPAPAQTLYDGFHQIAPAQRVAGAVQAQHRHRDFREMRVAQLFGPPRRMKGIGE